MGRAPMMHPIPSSAIPANGSRPGVDRTPEPAATDWRPVGDRLSAPQQVDNLGDGEDSERHGGQRQPVAEIVPVADDHPNWPVAGELPIDASIIPIPQAISPFGRLAPERTLTMVMPRIVSSRSSPVPKASTSGRAIMMARRQDDGAEHAADERGSVGGRSARGRLAFLAMGKPSSTVACEEPPPGIPISTDSDGIAGRHDGQQADHHGDAVA